MADRRFHVCVIKPNEKSWILIGHDDEFDACSYAISDFYNIKPGDIVEVYQHNNKDYGCSHIWTTTAPYIDDKKLLYTWTAGPNFKPRQ